MVAFQRFLNGLNLYRPLDWDTWTQKRHTYQFVLGLADVQRGKVNSPFSSSDLSLSF